MFKMLLSTKGAHLPKFKSVRPFFNNWDKIKFKSNNSKYAFLSSSDEVGHYYIHAGHLLFRLKDPCGSGSL